MSKETILVTGGAGYIGSHTIVSLLETTHYDVISADNYANSTARTYERIEAITGKKVNHVEADLSIEEDVEALFRNHPNISGVIHFAAHKSVPESVLYPEKYYRNNINSLLNILEIGKKYNLRKIIFSSSCSVYGNIETLPVSETTPLSVTESPYAYTKLVGEQILRDVINGNQNLTGIALRYFNPVGAHASGHLGELPNSRPNNLVPVITQTAIGKTSGMKIFGNDYTTRDGTCVRDYVHVCDIAEAHVLALKMQFEGRSANRYDLFNLGSGNGVTVLEAIHAFEKTSGKKLSYEFAPRRAGDVAAIYSDSTKALKELNWKTSRSLDQMMESAWKWELHLAQNG
jgi:UDP-glucose 4-epimerase